MIEDFLNFLFKNFGEKYFDELDLNQINKGLMHGVVTMKLLKIRRQSYLDLFYISGSLSDVVIETPLTSRQKNWILSIRNIEIIVDQIPQNNEHNLAVFMKSHIAAIENMCQQKLKKHKDQPDFIKESLFCFKTLEIKIEAFNIKLNLTKHSTHGFISSNIKSSLIVSIKDLYLQNFQQNVEISPENIQTSQNNFKKLFTFSSLIVSSNEIDSQSIKCLDQVTSKDFQIIYMNTLTAYLNVLFDESLSAVINCDVYVQEINLNWIKKFNNLYNYLPSHNLSIEIYQAKPFILPIPSLVNPQTIWKYAIQSQLSAQFFYKRQHLVHAPISFYKPLILNRLSSLIKYKRLYTNILLSQKVTDQNALRNYEKALSTNTILLIRQSIFEHVKRELPVKSTNTPGTESSSPINPSHSILSNIKSSLWDGYESLKHKFKSNLTPEDVQNSFYFNTNLLKKTKRHNSCQDVTKEDEYLSHQSPSNREIRFDLYISKSKISWYLDSLDSFEFVPKYKSNTIQSSEIDTQNLSYLIDNLPLRGLCEFHITKLHTHFRLIQSTEENIPKTSYKKFGHFNDEEYPYRIIEIKIEELLCLDIYNRTSPGSAVAPMPILAHIIGKDVKRKAQAVPEIHKWKGVCIEVKHTTYYESRNQEQNALPNSKISLRLDPVLISCHDLWLWANICHYFGTRTSGPAETESVGGLNKNRLVKGETDILVIKQQSTTFSLITPAVQILFFWEPDKMKPMILKGQKFIINNRSIKHVAILKARSNAVLEFPHVLEDSNPSKPQPVRSQTEFRLDVESFRATLPPPALSLDMPLAIRWDALYYGGSDFDLLPIEKFAVDVRSHSRDEILLQNPDIKVHEPGITFHRAIEIIFSNFTINSHDEHTEAIIQGISLLHSIFEKVLLSSPATGGLEERITAMNALDSTRFSMIVDELVFEIFPLEDYAKELKDRSIGSIKLFKPRLDVTDDLLSKRVSQKYSDYHDIPKDSIRETADIRNEQLFISAVRFKFTEAIWYLSAPYPPTSISYPYSNPEAGEGYFNFDNNVFDDGLPPINETSKIVFITSFDISTSNEISFSDTQCSPINNYSTDAHTDAEEELPFFLFNTEYFRNLEDTMDETLLKDQPELAKKSFNRMSCVTINSELYIFIDRSAIIQANSFIQRFIYMINDIIVKEVEKWAEYPYIIQGWVRQEPKIPATRLPTALADNAGDVILTDKKDMEAFTPFSQVTTYDISLRAICAEFYSDRGRNRSNLSKRERSVEKFLVRIDAPKLGILQPPVITISPDGSTLTSDHIMPTTYNFTCIFITVKYPSHERYIQTYSELFPPTKKLTELTHSSHPHNSNLDTYKTLIKVLCGKNSQHPLTEINPDTENYCLEVIYTAFPTLKVNNLFRENLRDVKGEKNIDGLRVKLGRVDFRYDFHAYSTIFNEIMVGSAALNKSTQRSTDIIAEDTSIIPKEDCVAVAKEIRYKIRLSGLNLIVDRFGISDFCDIDSLLPHDSNLILSLEETDAIIAKLRKSFSMNFSLRRAYLCQGTGQGIFEEPQLRSFKLLPSSALDNLWPVKPIMELVYVYAFCRTEIDSSTLTSTSYNNVFAENLRLRPPPMQQSDQPPKNLEFRWLVAMLEGIRGSMIALSHTFENSSKSNHNDQKTNDVTSKSTTKIRMNLRNASCKLPVSVDGTNNTPPMEYYKLSLSPLILALYLDSNHRIKYPELSNGFDIGTPKDNEASGALREAHLKIGRTLLIHKSPISPYHDRPSQTRMICITFYPLRRPNFNEERSREIPFFPNHYLKDLDNDVPPSNVNYGLAVRLVEMIVSPPKRKHRKNLSIDLIVGKIDFDIHYDVTNKFLALTRVIRGLVAPKDDGTGSLNSKLDPKSQPHPEQNRFDLKAYQTLAGLLRIRTLSILLTSPQLTPVSQRQSLPKILYSITWSNLDLTFNVWRLGSCYTTSSIKFGAALPALEFRKKFKDNKITGPDAESFFQTQTQKMSDETETAYLFSGYETHDSACVPLSFTVSQKEIGLLRGGPTKSSSMSITVLPLYFWYIAQAYSSLKSLLQNFSTISDPNPYHTNTSSSSASSQKSLETIIERAHSWMGSTLLRIHLSGVYLVLPLQEWRPLGNTPYTSPIPGGPKGSVTLKQDYFVVISILDASLNASFDSKSDQGTANLPEPIIIGTARNNGSTKKSKSFGKELIFDNLSCKITPRHILDAEWKMEQLDAKVASFRAHTVPDVRNLDLQRIVLETALQPNQSSRHYNGSPYVYSSCSFFRNPITRSVGSFLLGTTYDQDDQLVIKDTSDSVPALVDYGYVLDGEVIAGEEIALALNTCTLKAIKRMHRLLSRDVRAPSDPQLTTANRYQGSSKNEGYAIRFWKMKIRSHNLSINLSHKPNYLDTTSLHVDKIDITYVANNGCGVKTDKQPQTQLKLAIDSIYLMGHRGSLEVRGASDIEIIPQNLPSATILRPTTLGSESVLPRPQLMVERLTFSPSKLPPDTLNIGVRPSTAVLALPYLTDLVKTLTTIMAEEEEAVRYTLGNNPKHYMEDVHGNATIEYPPDLRYESSNFAASPYSIVAPKDCLGRNASSDFTPEKGTLSFMSRFQGSGGVLTKRPETDMLLTDQEGDMPQTTIDVQDFTIVFVGDDMSTPPSTQLSLPCINLELSFNLHFLPNGSGRLAKLNIKTLELNSSSYASAPAISSTEDVQHTDEIGKIFILGIEGGSGRLAVKKESTGRNGRKGSSESITPKLSQMVTVTLTRARMQSPATREISVEGKTLGLLSLVGDLSPAPKATVKDSREVGSNSGYLLEIKVPAVRAIASPLNAKIITSVSRFYSEKLSAALTSPSAEGDKGQDPTTVSIICDTYSIKVEIGIIQAILLDDHSDVEAPLFQLILRDLQLKRNDNTMYYTNCGRNELHPLISPLIVSSRPGSRVVNQKRFKPDHNSVVGYTIESCVSIFYYNGYVCGWDSFLEPWKLSCTLGYGKDLFKIGLQALNRLNLNFTPTLINLCHDLSQTASSFIKDAQNINQSGFKEVYSQKILVPPTSPWVYRNDTGTSIEIAYNPGPNEQLWDMEGENISNHKFSNTISTPKYHKLFPGASIDFRVLVGGYYTDEKKSGKRGKQLDTLVLSNAFHQILVRIVESKLHLPSFDMHVNGSYIATLIKDPDDLSIVKSAYDPKVGDTKSMELINKNVDTSFKNVIVFDLSQRNSQCKLVSIQSPIKLINHLAHDVEITFHAPSATVTAKSTSNLYVRAGGRAFFIPLQHVGQPFYIRPVLTKVLSSGQKRFCTTPIDYVLTLKSSPENLGSSHDGVVSYQTRVCLPHPVKIDSGFTKHQGTTSTSTSPIYKVCVAIGCRKMKIPNEVDEKLSTSSSSSSPFPSTSTNPQSDKISTKLSGMISTNLIDIRSHHMPILITFTSPIIIYNCLPYPLRFKVTKRQPNHGQTIHPGDCFHLNSLEPLNDISMRFQLENFVDSEPLIVPVHLNAIKGMGKKTELMPLFLKDLNDHKLILNVRCSYHQSGTIKIYVYANFWFLNKFGLPIIFRQHVEGATAYESLVIPAQYQEHEGARNLSPLLTSSLEHIYDSNIHTYSYSMRLGKKLHPLQEAKWCNPFKIGTEESFHRELEIVTGQGNSCMLYGISVQVIDGQGPKYGNSKFLIFKARHQILNKTPYSLQVTQSTSAPESIDNDPDVAYKSHLLGFMLQDTSPPHEKNVPCKAVETFHPMPATSLRNYATSHHLTIYPDSRISFHWSTDNAKDRLISVRIVLDAPSRYCPPSETCNGSDVVGTRCESLWSGRFPLDKVTSFHLHIRMNNGTSLFVLVENTFIENVYTTTFREVTSKLPPPYLIINRSSIPILYHQKGVTDERKRSVIQSHKTASYALDEPIGIHQLFLQVIGGTSGFYDLDNFGDSLSLSYDNYLFICFPSSSLLDPISTQKPTCIGLEDLSSEDVEDYVPRYTHGFKFPKSLTHRPTYLVMEAATSGQYIFLNHKEPGNKYQLWKLSPEGYLLNVGCCKTGTTTNSSPNAPKPDGTTYQGMGIWDGDVASHMVLDVSDNKYALRDKNSISYGVACNILDAVRRDKQTWSYSNQDSSITCQKYPNMRLQPKGGFDYSYKGNRIHLATHPKNRGGEAEQESGTSMTLALSSKSKSSTLTTSAYDKSSKVSNTQNFLSPSHEHSILSRQNETSASRVRLENSRPGSGLILVRLSARGPLKILEIYDAIKRDQENSGDHDSPLPFPPLSPHLELKTYKFDKSSEDVQNSLEIKNILRGTVTEESKSKLEGTLKDIEFSLKIMDTGLSFIDNQHLMEELVYATFTDVQFSFARPSKGDRSVVSCSVVGIQVDNQLFDAQVPIIFYTHKIREGHPKLGDSGLGITDPSPFYLLIDKDLTFDNTYMDVFNHIFLYLGDCSLKVEELLVLKLIKFLEASSLINTSKKAAKLADSVKYGDLKGYNYLTSQDTTDPLLSRDPKPAPGVEDETTAGPRRLYAAKFIVSLRRINLSVCTTAQANFRILEKGYRDDLLRLKKFFRINLINLQGAPIEMEPFVLMHFQDTWSLLMEKLICHYIENTKRQAAKILGSINFLGNPLGLLNDVTQGVSSLVKDGDLTAMICSITHGLSDSTAKMSTELSDQLGRVTMDQSHELMRHQIKRINQPHLPSTDILVRKPTSSGQIVATSASRSLDHMITAVEGLTIGFVGGVMSIFTQTYEGVAKDGIEGLIPGIGKGVVGSFAKPITGLLDFISGTARAIKVTALAGSGNAKEGDELQRIRLSRCCYDTWGTLPLYSHSQAFAHQLMVQLNNYDTIMERLIGYQQWHATLKKQDAIRMLLITDSNLYILEARSESSSSTSNDLTNYFDSLEFTSFKIKYQIPMFIVRGVNLLEKHEGKSSVVIHLNFGQSLIPLTLPVPSREEAQGLMEKLQYAKYLYDIHQRKLED